MQLARSKDRSPGEVARELGLAPTTLWRWMREADTPERREERGRTQATQLDASERGELNVLRREVIELREERDILKKATAFFAKESK